MFIVNAPSNDEIFNLTLFLPFCDGGDYDEV